MDRSCHNNWDRQHHNIGNENNKKQISNPNRIYVGQELVINQ